MDESKTDPDWNSFYSTDYTSHTSYRPLLTVTYSYSLPTGLSNGGIYSFQNVGSNSIMNVHNGTNANDTNVYQINTSPSSATNAQKFKLDYVSSMDCYYLRAMCSSSGTNRVLDIVKSDGFVEDGGNVQIYKPVDDLAQYWLIIHLGGGEFLLLPRTNANLALTTYGNSNGTSGGQTSTSAGNIFVSYYNGSDYQKWKIYDHSSSGYIIPNNGSILSLNYSTISVDEGETKTIIATTNPSGLTVSWSTDSPSVATVNSQGVVTGVAAKASPVTITASVSLPNETTYTETCQVYTTAADGVYYIKNQKSGYYMTANNVSIANLTDVIQTSKYGTSYTDIQKLTQMWKIKYLSDGRYSIRPMHKLTMGLDVTISNVDIFGIGVTDTLSGVADCAEWTIDRYTNSSSGCIFMNKGLISSTAHISGGNTTSGASVVAENYASTTDYRWDLEIISNPPCGIIFYNSHSCEYITSVTQMISAGKTRSLSQMSLIPAFYSGGSIDQSLYWFSSDSSVVTVNSSSGSITGVSVGNATIYGRKSVSGVYYYISYDVRVIPIYDAYHGYAGVFSNGSQAGMSASISLPWFYPFVEDSGESVWVSSSKDSSGRWVQIGVCYYSTYSNYKIYTETFQSGVYARNTHGDKFPGNTISCKVEYSDDTSLWEASCNGIVYASGPLSS